MHAWIIISGLLPRKDPLNGQVIPFYNNLEKFLTEKPNITFINHKNITLEDMKDKKHLSQDSVNNFAKNLKAAFFNTKPRNEKRKPIRKSEQFDKNQRELPTRRNPKPMFNKYNPEPRLPTSFIENITWLRGNMKFISSVNKISHE